MSSEISESICGIVRRHVDAGEIPGGITLLAHKGELVHLDAYGLDGEQEPRALKQDSIFFLASMTKPVTAAAATLLMEEGLIRPDDPVSRYVPEFARPRQVRILKPGHQHQPFVHDSGAPLPRIDTSAPAPEFDYEPVHRELTVHDIMSFTSGLQTIGIPNDALPVTTPEDTLASYVAKLGDVPLEFQPGTSWHYSNSTGYEVLARIIEVASQQQFAQFVQERLFNPLDMQGSAFGEQPAIKDRVTGLGPLAGGRSSRIDYASGSAGLFAPARDYWHFAQMLLDGGTFRGRQIIPESGVLRMRQNQIGDLPFPGVRSVEYSARNPASHPGVRYGYGLALIEDREASGTMLPARSFGWDGVGTRRFWAIPELEAVLVMLMPGLGLPADAAHREIEAFVVRALG